MPDPRAPRPRSASHSTHQQAWACTELASALRRTHAIEVEVVVHTQTERAELRPHSGDAYVAAAEYLGFVFDGLDDAPLQSALFQQIQLMLDESYPERARNVAARWLDREVIYCPGVDALHTDPEAVELLGHWARVIDTMPSSGPGRQGMLFIAFHADGVATGRRKRVPARDIELAPAVQHASAVAAQPWTPDTAGAPKGGQR